MLIPRTPLILATLIAWCAPASAASVTPPRLLTDPGATYPAEALAARVPPHVEVVLVLVLDTTGAVAEASVETPRGHGFDEAALVAARGLRFEPARRDGAPVAARIRYRYVFEAPPATPPVVHEPPEASQKPSSAAVSEPALEVTVRGERAAPGVVSYTRAEVRQIPGAFGDPFRAVETLPGVTPIASGLPFFYVRGAPPGNVAYFLDGVRVPYLYHIGFGPSVVHPGLVERVDLHAGGYPARLGRFTGGAVSAETVSPSATLHGEGNLRLLDVGALVETGFADGRGTALLGGRYSYTAALVSLAAPRLKLDYRDYQARVSYDVTQDDRVSLLSFGSYDLLALEKNGLLDVLFGTEFYRADLRYDRRLEGGKLRVAATFGLDRTSAAFIAGERRNVTTHSVAGRTELELALGPALQLRAGADAGVERHRVDRPPYGDPDSPETREFDALFPARTDRAAGGWLDLVLYATPRIQVIPGVRVDVFTSGRETAWSVDPRLAARFIVSPRFRLIHAYGMAHQAPSFALPVPGLTIARLRQGLQKSIQASSGAELDLDDATTLSLSAFYNVFLDLSDALGTSDGDGPPAFAERSDGRAFGAEFYLKRRLTRRIGGYLSYTLSRSTRRLDSGEFPSATDRTHVVSGAVSHALGRGWRAGARFTLYSGAPVQQERPGPAASRSESPERDPFFFRLDLRLEKRWLLSSSRWLSFVAEFMNGTLTKEKFAGEEIGPVVIPSLGLEAGF